MARHAQTLASFRVPASAEPIGKAVLRVYVVRGSRHTLTLGFSSPGRPHVASVRRRRVRSNVWLDADLTPVIGVHTGTRTIRVAASMRGGIVLAGPRASRPGLRPRLVLTPPVARPSGGDTELLRSHLVAMLQDVAAADGRRYAAHDDAGVTLDCLKIIAARAPGPRYLGVYHALIGDRFRLRVATSDNLLDWHHSADLDTDAAQGTIARFGPGGFVVAYEKRLGDGIHIRVRDYASEDDLLTGHYRDQFTAPLTLAPTAEGTPSITAAAGGPVPEHSRIDLGLHYYADARFDREATARLTDFSTWHAEPAPAIDAEFAQFGIRGNIGDRDPFTVGGRPFTLFEAQKSAGDWGSWRTFLYDASADRMVALKVQTDHGSGAFGNPTATVVTGPTGAEALVVTQFLFSEAAPPGESGSLIYYRLLDPVDALVAG